MPTSSFDKHFVFTDPEAIRQIRADDICATLTDATGITFKLGEDTREPQAVGEVLNYWITTSNTGFHRLTATNFFGDTVIDESLNIQDIIKKVNDTERLI